MFSYFFMPKLRTYCISHKFLRQLDSLGLKLPKMKLHMSEKDKKLKSLKEFLKTIK